MKTGIVWVGVAVWIGLVSVWAEDQPARSADQVAAETNTAIVNKAAGGEDEIKALLEEVNRLQNESRTLTVQLQDFAADLGTNNVALHKLSQDWQEAQSKADHLRAQLQEQIEKSPSYKSLKTRREVADERMLQIRTQLRDLMKERGLHQSRMRQAARPVAAPRKSIEQPAGEAPQTKPE